MRVPIELPPGYAFRRTVFSHGWTDLAPFTASDDGDAVGTVVALPRGGARRISLRRGRGAAVLEIEGAADAATRRRLVAAARRILALHVDLSGFHAAVAGDAHFGWIAATGTGRLLRSPSTFEDVVKLVLTTNCSWAFTKKMCEALVARYGEEAPDGSRAFPTAARLAALTQRDLRTRVRAGYRAPYLVGLARAVHAGEVDPEAWETDRRPASELRHDILALPGVGPYVAENLLKFMGKPDGLGLDSAMRAGYAKKYHGGRKVTDRTIARRTARLGAWAGLALWFDLARDWFPLDDAAAADGGTMRA